MDVTITKGIELPKVDLEDSRARTKKRGGLQSKQAFVNIFDPLDEVGGKLSSCNATTQPRNHQKKAGTTRAKKTIWGIPRPPSSTGKRDASDIRSLIQFRSKSIYTGAETRVGFL